MPDLDTIREKAAAHARELEARASFWTVTDLAARWGCSRASVTGIPRARLPYTEIGRGTQRHHRRYNPEDVRAYEAGRESAA